MFVPGSFITVAPERRYGLPDSEGGYGYVVAVSSSDDGSDVDDGPAAPPIQSSRLYTVEYVIGNKRRSPNV